jgi:toxin YoeB
MDDDRQLARQIVRLVEEVKRDPLSGIGKPEPLKHEVSGYWSRQINEEHRMIDKAVCDDLLTALLRYHY